MYMTVGYVNLQVPKYAMTEMLQRLITAYQNTYQKDPTITLTTDETVKVRELLKVFGYVTSVDPINHAIVVNECLVEELDPEKDPVLCALDGITPMRSYLTTSGDDNSQWQIRYNRRTHWAVPGEVIFPEDKYQTFPCRYKPGEPINE